MSRPIEIGDFVRIYHIGTTYTNDYSDTYTIKSIYEGKLPAMPGKGEYNGVIISINDINHTIILNLVEKNNKWTIYNVNDDYDIEFMQPVLFTGIRNVDMNILLQLDDENLSIMCQVNKYSQSLCNDNIFWRLKIDQLYAGTPIPQQYKDDYRQFYQELTSSSMWSYEKSAYENLLNIAIEKGFTDVIKWVIETKEIYPKQWALKYASNDTLEYLKIYDIHYAPVMYLAHY